MHHLLSALLLLAPPAAPLKITGPERADPYRLVRLSVEGDLTDAVVAWDVSPEDVADVEELPGGRLLLVGPPGVYRIKARILRISEGKISGSTLRHTVVIGTPPGPPAPPPMPPPTADPVAATGKLRVGNSGCTATVIWPRRGDGKWDILTAAHCVGEVGSGGTLRLKSGLEIGLRLKAKDKRADIAWFETDEAGFATLPYVRLSAISPDVGAKVYQHGYGINQPTVRKDGVVIAAPNGDQQISFRLSVSSGDSGGPIFRADNHEVVACVCCTSAMGRDGQMWGGGCEQAARLRPRVTEWVDPWSLLVPAMMPAPR